ncbi:MAG: hypothetical protein FJ290_19785 [Planctomycetes bacterium]|nr:hypothetical protein [Planctomycetota bacterium]
MSKSGTEVLVAVLALAAFAIGGLVVLGACLDGLRNALAGLAASQAGSGAQQFMASLAGL